VRSLFGDLKGCDRCLEVEGCDRCLGKLRECDRYLGVEECDRCLGSWRECDRSYSVSSVSLWFVKKGCWGVQGMRSLFGKLRGCDRYLGSLRGAIAKRDLGIAVWGSWRGAIAFGELERVRSLFGKLEGVRSLFGKFEGCDSEARPRNRCLGSWRGAIALPKP
jgi:hypothetical protein